MPNSSPSNMWSIPRISELLLRFSNSLVAPRYCDGFCVWRSDNLQIFQQYKMFPDRLISRALNPISLRVYYSYCAVFRVISQMNISLFIIIVYTIQGDIRELFQYLKLDRRILSTLNIRGTISVVYFYLLGLFIVVFYRDIKIINLTDCSFKSWNSRNK